MKLTTTVPSRERAAEIQVEAEALTVRLVSTRKLGLIGLASNLALCADTIAKPGRGRKKAEQAWPRLAQLAAENLPGVELA
jgi:hypothetical protein